MEKRGIVLAVAGAGGAIGTGIFFLYHYNQYRTKLRQGLIPPKFSFWDYLRIIVFHLPTEYPITEPSYVTEPQIARNVF